MQNAKTKPVKFYCINYTKLTLPASRKAVKLSELAVRNESRTTEMLSSLTDLEFTWNVS